MGEDLLIELMGIAPSKCNIYSSDEFILDVSNNNDKIKIVPHYAGNALVIAEYKNVKDTCNVKSKAYFILCRRANFNIRNISFGSKETNVTIST